MGKFQPGQSGNPAGRRPGSKDRRTELRELIQVHAPSLVTKAVELALDGDRAALKICMDRIVSPLRATSSVSPAFALRGNSLSEQAKEVTAALAAGAMSADEANALMSLLAAQARILETSELARRVEALEQAGGVHGDQEPE